MKPDQLNPSQTGLISSSHHDFKKQLDLTGEDSIRLARWEPKPAFRIAFCFFLILRPLECVLEILLMQCTICNSVLRVVLFLCQNAECKRRMHFKMKEWILKGRNWTDTVYFDLRIVLWFSTCTLKGKAKNTKCMVK